MLKIFQNSFRTYSIFAFKNHIRLLQQLLYPLKCLKCGNYIDPETVKPHTMEACFCDGCMASRVYPIDTPFCTRCGLKFHKSFNENHVCEACLKKPLNLGQVRAALEYKGIIKDAIPLFKYHSKLSLAKVFEHLLFQAFLNHYASAKIDLIMPIPLHTKKLRKRGFNQAFLLIRNFMKYYENTFEIPPPWKIDTTSLARIKRTQPQTGFDIEQRKVNLKNAFNVANQKAIDKKHILLVDDVFTTGATCNEAARVLLKNGAENVYAMVLART
jgi:ComF family protein